MKVTFDNVYNAFQIIAPKGTMISFTGEPTALADGVYLVGDDGIINLDEQFLTDTLYLSTEGTDYAVTGGMRVTYPLGDETVIIRAGSSTIPFSKGGKGGGGSGDGTHYKGTTTTALTNGSTTNPITIDGESYTAVFGDIVVYGYTEFVFDGTQWSEFGRPFDTTPTSGSANAVTSDGIYQVTPSRRGTGTASVATGYATTASGNRSIVGGDTSKGTATNAVAIGNHCEASGQSSIALNYYTKATQSNSVVIGEVNDPKNGDLFEIGNGVDAQHRSNIVEVNKTSLNVNGEIKKNGVSLPTPYTTMPTITEAMLGQIAQYVGETTNDYVKGYFYIASSDGADEPTYSWVSMVDNTPINGSKNFVTSGAVYSRTPLMRGTGNRSAVGGYQTSATASNCISYGANTVASGAQSVAFGAGTQATNADQMLSSIQPAWPSVKAAVKKITFSDMPKELKIKKLYAGLQGSINRLNLLQGTYDRINAKVRTGKRGRPARVSDDTTIPRYTLGKVPNTNVKLIALFRIYDFNFSDAIKHGSMRSNDWIEDFTGMKSSNVDRLGKGANSKGRVDVKYDNNVDASVAGNFSLNGIYTNPFDLDKNNGHYKQQYGYNDENYTSVAQFMDKSVMGAAYALKKENIDVDYIIDAPSSSSFNHYYCTNLANKTGIEYRQGFFKRNMLNVSVDTEKMRKNGFSEAMIDRTKDVIKDAAIHEITSYMTECVERFVDESFAYLRAISVTKSSRVKVSKPLLIDVLRELSFYGLVNIKKNNPNVTNLYKYLVNHFSEYNGGMSKSTKFDISHIVNVTSEILRTRLSKKYQKLLVDIDSIVIRYEKILLENGMKISNSKKLKAVDIDKRMRPYLKDFYVVADSEMAYNKNGIVDKLRGSLMNKHFLI